MIFSIPWYVIIFQTIPETLLIIKLGLRLYNIQIKAKECLLISVIVSFIAYFIRKILFIIEFNKVFGIHTFLMIIATVYLIRVITKNKVSHIFICILTSSLLDGVLQSITAPIFLSITKKNINDLFLSPILNILFFIPCIIIMMIIYFKIKNNNLYLLDLKLYSEDCENIVKK